ncbi:MAG TPA: hypothetical protein VJS30_23465 [Paraburkholderia sp.]|nr:hypothetical protein [Paraburkholderia sp.]
MQELRARIDLLVTRYFLLVRSAPDQYEHDDDRHRAEDDIAQQLAWPSGLARLRR